MARQLPPTLFLSLLLACVCAQPSPAQQARIAAAIKNATTNPVTDFTAFVNPFIGTGRAFNTYTRREFTIIRRQLWRCVVSRLVWIRLSLLSCYQVLELLFPLEWFVSGMMFDTSLQFLLG